VPIYVCPVCKRVINLERDEVRSVPWIVGGAVKKILLHKDCFNNVSESELTEILKIQMMPPQRGRRGGGLFPFRERSFPFPSRRRLRRGRGRGRTLYVSPEEAEEARWNFSEALVRAEKAIIDRDLERFADAFRDVKENWDLVLFARGKVMSRKDAELSIEIERWALKGDWKKVQEGFDNLRRSILGSKS